MTLRVGYRQLQQVGDCQIDCRHRKQSKRVMQGDRRLARRCQVLRDLAVVVVVVVAVGPVVEVDRSVAAHLAVPASASIPLLLAATVRT